MLFSGIFLGGVPGCVIDDRACTKPSVACDYYAAFLVLEPYVGKSHLHHFAFDAWTLISCIRDAFGYRNIAPRPEEEKLYFLRQWSTVTKNVQSPDNVLRNIRDLPPIGLQQVPEWIMDRVKDAADDYVRGRWLSSIALCGVIGEFLSFHLLENYVRDAKIGQQYS